MSGYWMAVPATSIIKGRTVSRNIRADDVFKDAVVFLKNYSEYTLSKIYIKYIRNYQILSYINCQSFVSLSHHRCHVPWRVWAVQGLFELESLFVRWAALCIYQSWHLPGLCFYQSWHLSSASIRVVICPLHLPELTFALCIYQSWHLSSASTRVDICPLLLPELTFVLCIYQSWHLSSASTRVDICILLRPESTLVNSESTLLPSASTRVDIFLLLLPELIFTSAYHDICHLLQPDIP